MYSLQVERLSATATLPTRAHPHDAGLDLYADQSLSLAPGQRQTVKTGIKLAIDPGYTGLVWDKSGLANQGLHCLAGVIDADYRGEVQIVVINLGSETIEIAVGQKIAQLLIQPVSTPPILETIIRDETTRGDQGFGSSGL
jgi:dUTP pyrophosphatase